MLANEQTYLSWLGFSDAFALLGVVIAQISRIRNLADPDGRGLLCNYLLGKPQSCFCYAMAIFTLVFGAYRFFRQQHALTVGYARVGGPELPLMGVSTGVVRNTIPSS